MKAMSLLEAMGMRSAVQMGACAAAVLVARSVGLHVGLAHVCSDGRREGCLEGCLVG